MLSIANIVVALVAALHLYFLVLEMFLWTKPLGAIRRPKRPIRRCWRPIKACIMDFSLPA
jgi:hypothetical protein